MSLIALVRVAEPWTVWNIFGAIFLVVVVAGIVSWWLRRR
jgi:hypothetical protein